MKTLLTKPTLKVALVSLLIMSFFTCPVISGNSNLISSSGNAITLTDDSDVYIDNTALAPDPDIQIYPNPVSRQFVYAVNNLPQGSYTLEIYNSIGQMVMSVFNGQQLASPFYTTSIDISALPNGMYFARLYNGSMMKTVRLVKQQH